MKLSAVIPERELGMQAYHDYGDGDENPPTLKCQDPFLQLQFMVGNLQEGRIPMDRLDNVLHHFGDSMGCCCSFVFVMSKKFLRHLEPYPAKAASDIEDTSRPGRTFSHRTTAILKGLHIIWIMSSGTKISVYSVPGSSAFLPCRTSAHPACL